jgi:hypothetical protein
MPEDRDRATVEHLIHASPSAVFDLIADPSRHVELDGSGQVRATGARPSGSRWVPPSA